MKFCRKVKLPEAYARVEWCKKHLGPQVQGGNWWRHKGHIYFTNEKFFTLYALHWT